MVAATLLHVTAPRVVEPGSLLMSVEPEKVTAELNVITAPLAGMEEPRMPRTEIHTTRATLDRACNTETGTKPTAPNVNHFIVSATFRPINPTCRKRALMCAGAETGGQKRGRSPN